VRFHHFDNQGQVHRESQHLVGVQLARRTEPGDAAQHRRARESFAAKSLQQRLVQRLAVIAIALADEDAHQRPFAAE